MIEKLKKLNINKKILIKIFVLCVFVLMLLVNLLTPLIADDYSYALNNNHTRLSSIIDIYNYQVRHYFEWGGRTVAHSIAQLFLMLPKWIFSIANSIVFTLMTYLIYLFGKGKSKVEKPYLFLAIFLALYFLVPAFGQNCIWLVGSCNYIWTMLLMLLLIYQYIFKEKKEDTLLRIILMFMFGIICGWTNENIAVGLIIMIFLLVILNKNKQKWKISGIIGTIIGFLIMILAPGNRVRSALFIDNDFIIIKWIKRFIHYTLDIYDYCIPLIVTLVLLITIYIYNHKKINSLVYIFLAGAFFSIYSMVLSPEFPKRSWFGIIVFIIISIAILLSEIDKIHSIIKPIIYDALIISTFLFIKDYAYLVVDINNLRNTWNSRINYIETNEEEGEIVFSKYYTINKKNPNYGLADINSTETEWPNYEIACYYDVIDRGIITNDE